MTRRPIDHSPTFDKEADTRPTRDSDVCGRPTLAPPFDLEVFAREKMAAPDERAAPSELPTRPPPDAAASSIADPPSGTHSKARSKSSDPLDEPRAKFRAGDYAGALVLAEAALEDDRLDQAASELANDCRRMLEQTYVGRLGSLERVPTLALQLGEIRTLAIDHRGAFLLSHVDGVSTLEMMLDISGMPRLDALRILFGFYEEGIITLD